jgi:hypothetical protein
VIFSWSHVDYSSFLGASVLCCRTVRAVAVTRFVYEPRRMVAAHSSAPHSVCPSRARGFMLGIMCVTGDGRVGQPPMRTTEESRRPRDQSTCRCPVSRLESAVVQRTPPDHATRQLDPSRTESGRSCVVPHSSTASIYVH